MNTTAVSSATSLAGLPLSATAASAKPLTLSGGPATDAPDAPPPTTSAESGRALEVFRQELRVSGTAKSTTEPVYPYCDCEDYKTSVSAEQVATAALDTAGRAVAENSDVSSYALLRFRQRVQAAAVVTRESVGADQDIGQVDSALGKIESGLEALDAEAARNVESTASVLAVDSRSRQRSTIRIRTQEGDVVRLDLRQSSRLSARDESVTDANGSSTRTEVSASSRSRLNFSVRGDINEAELAAIENVFAQAESIAGEFFGGDLAAAFSVASSFEFDAGQLAKVNLRFRSREVTSTAFSQTVSRAPGVVADVPAEAAAVTAGPAPAVVPAPVASSSAPAAVDSTEATPPGSTVQISASEESSVTSTAETGASDVAPPTVDLGSDTFLRFFDLLGDFLRSVSGGFEREEAGTGTGIEAGSTRLKFHYSQGLKFEIFKSVLQTAAPDDSASKGVELAAALIDGLTEPSVPGKTAES